MENESGSPGVGVVVGVILGVGVVLVLVIFVVVVLVRVARHRSSWKPQGQTGATTSTETGAMGFQNYAYAAGNDRHT